jgi:hypothetical protein
MTIAQGQTATFKQNLLSGLENFAAGTPYVYKIALYTSSANLGSATTAYTASGEVTALGYETGGAILTPIGPMSDPSSGVGYVSFEPVSWSGATFTARGALIYNATTLASVCVLNFGNDKTANGTFTITFPPNNSTNAIIRIA